ncbi:PD-(D/E)XK nuclease family protein [Bifidobacterium myosotis]|uniref:PD-(D/E)XK nuclease family protein n=1 Tax=Bifidobacterium myosotis TaxID=1630166 RepID=A0A5M9ZLL6_9BIFI|nr:PD-(D/E)XK nuclease family protein [Bifidobacterium myosotis]KAA8828203.1 PD-(D/E)XK nuclease family protein [Bifidobacterium myosotis]
MTAIEPVMTFDPAHGVVHASTRRPSHASFSALDGWLTCPGRWVANRLLPKPIEWGSPLVLGGIAHAALELACRTPENQSPDWGALTLAGIRLERDRVAARGWGDEPVPAGVPMPDGREAGDADWARAAADRLSGFALSDALGRPLEPVAMEQELHADVAGIPLTGSVDCRDAAGIVVDWKTGRVPARADGRRRHADQLRVYRMLLETAGVCEVRGARDVYVEHRAWADADISDAACTDTLSRLHPAWDGMLRATGDDGTGMFPLRPSGLCSWCPVARACPLARLIPAGARAAASSVGPDDPRVAVMGTHTAGVESFESRVSNGKEPALDLLAMIGGAPDAAAPGTDAGAAAAAPSKRWSPAAAAPVRRGPDPWVTPEGRATAAKWLGADAVGTDGSATEPEPKPATPADDDPWAKPVAPAPDDPWNPTKTESKPAEPEPEPAAPEAKPAKASDPFAGLMPGTAAPEPKPAAPEPKAPEPAPVKPTAGGPLRAVEGKPFEPSLTGTTLNVAGYGFGQLLMTHAHAAVLADGHDDWVAPIGMELLKVQWAAGRKAFGARVPDIPGLEKGAPDRAALLAWLDSTPSRDTERAVRALLDADPMLKAGESDTLDSRLDRIRAAGRGTYTALAAAITLIEA